MPVEFTIAIHARRDAGRALAQLRRALRGLRLGTPFGAISRGFGGLLGGIGSAVRAVARLALVAALGVPIAAGAAGALSAREFSGFERAIAEVSTLLPAGADSGALARTVKDTALAYGQAPGDTAKALYNAISAGYVDTADAARMLDISSRLGVATVTDGGDAFNALLASLKPYGLGVGAAGETADKLAAISRRGVDLGALASSLGSVAPAAATAGVSVDELLGAIATIGVTTNTGTSQAATQLRALFASIMSAQQGTRRVQQRFGVDLSNVFSVSRVEAVGLQQVLQDVRAELQELSSDDQKAAIQALVGSQEALLGFFTLSGAGAESFRSIVDESRNSSGMVERGFAVMSATIGFQFDRLKTAVRVLFIELGALFAPALGRLTSSIRVIVELIGRYIETLKADVHSALDGVGEFDGQELAARILYVGAVTVAAVRDLSTSLSGVGVRGPAGAVLRGAVELLAWVLDRLDEAVRGARVLLTGYKAAAAGAVDLAASGVNALAQFAVDLARSIQDAALRLGAEAIGTLQDALRLARLLAIEGGAAGTVDAIDRARDGLNEVRQSLRRDMARPRVRVHILDEGVTADASADAFDSFNASVSAALDLGGFAAAAERLRLGLDGLAPAGGAAPTLAEIRRQIEALGMARAAVAGGGVGGFAGAPPAAGSGAGQQPGGAVAVATSSTAQQQQQETAAFAMAREGALSFAQDVSGSLAGSLEGLMQGMEDMGDALAALRTTAVQSIVSTVSQAVVNLALWSVLKAAFGVMGLNVDAAGGAGRPGDLAGLFDAVERIQAAPSPALAAGAVVASGAVHALDSPTGRRRLSDAVGDAGPGPTRRPVVLTVDAVVADGAALAAALASNRTALTQALVAALQEADEAPDEGRPAARVVNL